MNYVVKARARLDLKKHWHYIARDNPPAADRLLDAAEQLGHQAATFCAIARSHPRCDIERQLGHESDNLASSGSRRLSET